MRLGETQSVHRHMIFWWSHFFLFCSQRMSAKGSLLQQVSLVQQVILVQHCVSAVLCLDCIRLHSQPQWRPGKR